ncbi:hypothetical protein AALB39_22020 [Lachnospiraceae bacterium 54-53]
MRLGIAGAGMIAKDLLSISPDLKDIEFTAIFGTESDRETMEGLR